MIRCFAVVGLSLATVTLAAQDTQGAAFEVASVKRSAFKRGNLLPVMNTGVAFPGGRWTALHIPVSRIVQTLYDVQPEQIAGAPPWFENDLFVIDARAGDPAASRQQVSEMARRLLAERFKLRFHVEQRPLEVQALVVARRDGRLGPGLRPTVCEVPIDDAQRPRCGSFTRNVIDGVWRFRMNGHMLSTLITLHRVEAVVGGSVFDRTGLTGRFDIDLDYVPDPATNALGTPGQVILAAMEEQLGLRVERRREPMDVIVIDSVEPPTPD